MDFSHLDDDTPPNAERTMIADIVATAARRQRTRRGAFVSVTTVCALAVGIGVVSAVGKPARNPRVAVIRDGGQSTTTSAAQTSRVPTTRRPETTSTIAPDPNVWVTVEIQLDQHQVQQGQDVTGTIVFNNTTSKRVTFANDNGCVGKWAVIVEHGDTRPTSFPITLECAHTPASPAKYTDFPPGVTRVPFRAITLYSTCSGDSCPRALPVGLANLWFVGPPEHIALPPAERITITHDAPHQQSTINNQQSQCRRSSPAKRTMLRAGFSAPVSAKSVGIMRAIPSSTPGK